MTKYPPQGTGSGGGTTDHAALSHLAYANALHTGFEPTVAKGNMTGSSPIHFDVTSQVIGGAVVASLVNDIGVEITEIDTGALANSDTVAPTSKAVKAVTDTKVVVAGQIGGTAASPTVIGITTTDPETLTIGDIADGEYLKRVGNALISGVPPSGAGVEFEFDVNSDVQPTEFTGTLCNVYDLSPADTIVPDVYFDEDGAGDLQIM